MYVSEIYASGFRCFGPDNALSIKLRRGLNILVGPNDSGKTAIIDAFRHVLWTRGDEFLRLEPSDFHVNAIGERISELFVRCSFDALTPDEEARFLEWCSNEAGTLRLHVCLRATLRKLAGGGYSVVPLYRTGKNGDALPLEGDLREYLRSTYLRPLRDAERELRSGRRSRLSKILGALPEMAKQAAAAELGEPATLTDTLAQADREVDANPAVRKVQAEVNTTYLNDLSFSRDPLSATLGLGARGSFDQLLERLELYLNPPPGHIERLARGLGYNNLLFMAAELLLLQSHAEQIPYLLIEEPEAHLHPQHQTLFMQVLERRSEPPEERDRINQQVQILISTHSPQFAASADLDTMVMVIGHKTFALRNSETKLEDDDYKFLQRFLDATKANLFFARGVIVVEGDAENILLPTLAKKIGKPLGKHGVSIVNVGHRGLFRYSRIFQRADNSTMPVPIALIPDRDIPPDAAKELVGDRLTEREWQAPDITAHMQALFEHDGGCVRTFPSQQWTFEFDLARQPGLAVMVHQAIQIAKGRRGRTRDQIAVEARAEVTAWQADNTKSADDVAVLIFASLHKKQVSKAVVAQELAALIDAAPDDPNVFSSKLPGYIVEAISYVTGPHQAPIQREGAHDQQGEIVRR
jgi:putative ATP-dependent endonuclease of OLD family